MASWVGRSGPEWLTSTGLWDKARQRQTRRGPVGGKMGLHRRGVTTGLVPPDGGWGSPRSSFLRPPRHFLNRGHEPRSGHRGRMEALRYVGVRAASGRGWESFSVARYPLTSYRALPGGCSRCWGRVRNGGQCHGSHLPLFGGQQWG